MRIRIIIISASFIMLSGLIVFFVFYFQSRTKQDELVLSAEIASKPGYRGYVAVSEPDGTVFAEWSSVEEYVIAAALSPDMFSLAIVTVSGGGCSVRIFDLQTGDERGLYHSLDTMFFDIGYLSGNRVYAISGDRCVILTNSASEQSSVQFPGEYLESYRSENGSMALTVTGYQADDGSRDLFYNGNQWAY